MKWKEGFLNLGFILPFLISIGIIAESITEGNPVKFIVGVTFMFFIIRMTYLIFVKS